MKRKGLVFAAVLLLAVLLFFLKEKNERDKGGNPTGTPVPTQKTEEPYVAKNVWIVSSGEADLTFYPSSAIGIALGCKPYGKAPE